MWQFGRTVIKYESKLRELIEFVPEFANFEEYLCPKFGEGLSLEIKKKLLVLGSQSYKKVVQLTLRVKKFIGERKFRGSFQKRKGLGFTSRQSLKKSRNFNSFGNFFGSGTDFVNSPQSIQSPQPSKLGTSPQDFAFRGKMMTKRCPRCR